MKLQDIDNDDLLDAVQTCASWYGVHWFEMMSRNPKNERDHKPVQRAKGMLAAILFYMYDVPYNQIGPAMGRHHTTIMYAVRNANTEAFNAIRMELADRQRRRSAPTEMSVAV